MHPYAVAARHPRHRRRRFAPRRLSAALAACALLTLSPGVALTPATAAGAVLPTGPTVVAGQAQVVTAGNRMTVTNTPQAILNWSSFSIGSGASVYFQQADAASQVLNRVTGNDPSQIFGSLGSNGRVWLLNPHGVLFGASARVDVAGLVASTLRLGDSDWLAGRYRFSAADGSSAGVLNQGEIRTSLGGTLALVGGSVGNEGLMQAPGGQVVLAAGQSVELVDTGAANLSVRISASAGEARNLGVIEAAGGRIDITAAAVNQQGVVRADALSTGPGGEIWIRATDGRSTVSGTVSAQGGSQGAGGAVVVLGREVGLLDGASVDVSGGLGGGSVIVGGGLHGKDARYANAQALYFSPNARIAADATAQGDGGSIVLWSDTATRAFGSLSARGGLLGGNGGYIETSGGWLDARPASVDTSAPRGRAGEWLLDPYNIELGDFLPDTLGSGPNFTAGAGNSTVNTNTIVAALNGGSNVTIYTGGVNGGLEHGDITATGANIVSNAATPGSLTLRADGNIVFLANTTISSSGPMAVTLLAGQGGDGYISIQDSTITTGTGTTRGNILLGGSIAGLKSDGSAFQGAGGFWNQGVYIRNSKFDVGTANIAISGVGLLFGVRLDSGTQLFGRNVTVLGQGTDASAGIGVRVESGASIDVDKSITIDGRGTDVGASIYANARLYVQPTATDTGALLSVSGRGGLYGILVSAGTASTPAFLADNGASISFSGAGATNSSVSFEANQSNSIIPIIDNTGGTNITVSGTGAGQNISVADNLVLGGNGLMLLQSTQDVYVQNATLGIAANKSLVAGNAIWIIDGATINGGTGTTQLTATSGGITFNNGSRLNVFGATTLSGSAVTLTSSQILSQPLGSTSLTINADTSISLNNSTIGTSNGGAMAVTLSGARAGSGQVTLNESTVSATGADITIGGTTSITGPTGPVGAAGGNVPFGVQLSNSTVSASGPASIVRLSGYSTQSGGEGVSMRQDSLVSASQVYLAGQAGSGVGIRMQDAARIEGLNQVLMTGTGFDAGLWMTGSSYVQVHPSSFNTSTGLGVTATATSSNSALSAAQLLNDGTLGGSLRAQNGANISMQATAANGEAIYMASSGFGSATVIDAGTGTSVTLNGLSGGAVRLTGSGGIVTGSGAFTVQTAGTFSMSNGWIDMSGSTTVNAGQIDISNFSALYSNVSPDLTLTLNATGNLSFTDSDVYSDNGAVNVNLLGRAGSVTLSNSSISTGTAIGPIEGRAVPLPSAGVGTFGNIVIGGDVGGITPTGSIFTGAGGNVPTGVSLNGMTLNTAGGGITVAGVSSQSGGIGVGLSQSTLTGGTVSITGAAALGRGLVATGTTDIAAAGNLSLLGRGADYGVFLQDAFSYSVTPPSFDSARVLLVQGRALTAATGIGLWADGDALGTPNLSASNGASLRLEGAAPASAVDLRARGFGSTLVSAGGGTNLFIGAFAPGGDMALRNAVIVGGDNSSILGSDTVDTRLLLDSTGFSAFGPVKLTATSVDLRGTTTVTSQGLGDAILVSGRNAPLTYLDNTAGSSLNVLPQGNSPLGRWIVYAADTTGGPNVLNIGGLAYDFKRYGASFGGWAGDVGDGVVLAAAKSAVVTAMVNPKPYDGTTAATLSNISIAPGVSGDVGLLVAGAASFASPNAGTGLAVTFDSAQPFSFTDGSNRPVYGYTLVNSFTGTITPKLLTGTITVSDKVYNGNTSASAGVTNISGLVGTQTVQVSASASFADKNVGVGKAVTGSFSVLNGSGGGLGSNYQFSGSFPTASISALPVTVTGLSAANKVYDATTLATVTGTATVGVLGGDSVTLGGAVLSNFADKNVGTGKVVAVSGYTLSGNDAGNYLLTQPSGLTANITPRPVQVAGLSASNKVYDATTLATVSGTATVGVLPGDQLTLLGTPVANFADKNVGNGKAVSVSGYTLDGSDAGNYTLSQASGLSANITPLGLQVGGVSATNKVYDANTVATLTGTATVSGLGGDQLTLGGTVLSNFVDKNVGNGKPVTVSGYTLNGNDAGNYTLAQPVGLSANITPLGLQVTGLMANNKVYDATTLATLTGTATVSGLGGDQLTLGGTVLSNFADKNVGNGKPVTVSGYTLNGNDAGNYTLAQPVGLSANITPLGLQVTGLTANNKVYDATTLATLTGTATVSGLGGDQLTLGGTVLSNFADKNVGNGKPVTVSGYTLNGNDAGNYTLAQPVGLSANITPLGLQVTGLMANNKVYDATTLATLTGTATVSGLGGDQLTLGGTVLSNFADKNVGNGKPVTVSGYTLNGNDAGNYTLAQPVGLSANITPLGLQVTGLTANNKVYDATTLATLTGTATVSGLGGDQLTLGGTVLSNFADKNVGNGKPVTVSGYTLNGNDAGNYTLAQPVGLSANITPLGLQVTGLMANNKVYDATTLATLTGTATVSGLGGDQLTLGGTVLSNFADKNVGNGKPVTVSGYTLNGNDAGNYTLAQPVGLSANITPLGLQVTGLTANNKVYDATTLATLTGTATVSGLGGDQLTLGGTVLSNFADKNVGNGKPVTVSGYTLNGNDAGNYTLAQPVGLSANITPLGLQVTGLTANNKVYDATTLATLTGTATVSGLGGDQLTLGGTVLSNFADKNVGNGKPVTVSGYTLNGNDAGNYTLAQPVGLSANITPLGLQVTGLTANNKVYDANTVATLTGTATVSGLGGDQLTLGGTVLSNFADKNVGNGKPVTVSGYTLNGNDAGNYTLAQPVGLSANITPLGLQVTGLMANNKVYDATTLATLTGTATVSGLGGDQLTLGGTVLSNFADKNVGNGKPVTVSGYTLNGNDAGNYTLAQPVGLSANITPLGLQVTGLMANNKVYDATTLATLTGTATVSGLGGDQLTLGGTVLSNFADKNVGNGKPVTVSGYTLGGNDAGNYMLSQPSGLSANITQLGLQVAGLSASNKVYDASTLATLTGVATVSPLSGDAVTLGGTALASFADKNVGNGKAVTVSGYTLGGIDAGNYMLSQPAGLSANITPLGLQVAGLSANNKVYDANTLATLTGVATVSPLGGDAVTLGGTALANFADKNVGDGKAVTVSGYTLGGIDAGNYMLRQPAGLSANITPLDLQVGGVTASNKVYDATTVATLTGTAIVNVLGRDAVTLGGTVLANFSDKSVGNGKAVSVGGYTLLGSDASNYRLLQPTGLRASITPLGLQVTGLTALGKVYDGTTTAALSGTARINPLAGDAVALGGIAAATFANRDAGVGKPVTVAGLVLGGVDASNYNLIAPQGLSATVSPATLVYVAQTAVRSVGQVIEDLQGSVQGFVPNDTLTNATMGALRFTSPAAAGVPPGSYAIFGSGLQARNYLFTQAAGNAQALSVVDLTPNTSAVTGSTLDSPGQTKGFATALSASRDRADGGVESLLSPPPPSGPVAPVGDFRALRLASLSAADLQGLLAGRDLFKKQLFADSIARLESNPGLADLQPCMTLEEARQGGCVITEAVKALQAQQPAGAPAPAPAPAPAAAPPAPTPAPTPAPAAPPAPTPAPAAAPPAPAPAPAGAPPPAPAPAPTPAPAPLRPLVAEVDPLQAQFDLLLAKRNVRAASLPQIERKIALVVGVGQYRDASIPSLGNAVRDAQAVARLFEQRLGYEAVVLDNATRASLVAALNRLALTLGPRDSVVIYYAGHGELIESTKLGYWLLADSKATDPTSWLSNTDITQLIKQMGASQVALVSDSCYSGSLASEERLRAQPGTPDPIEMLLRKSVVVMSSGGNEPVFDEGRDGHSPFAWNLMNQLGKIGTWQAGGNLFERVRFAVAREVPQRPQYSASRAAGHQPGGDYLFELRQLDAAK